MTKSVNGSLLSGLVVGQSISRQECDQRVSGNVKKHSWPELLDPRGSTRLGKP